MHDSQPGPAAGHCRAPPLPWSLVPLCDLAVLRPDAASGPSACYSARASHSAGTNVPRTFLRLNVCLACCIEVVLGRHRARPLCLSPCHMVPCRGHLLHPAARSRGHALPLIQCSWQQPQVGTQSADGLSQDEHQVCLSFQAVILSTDMCCFSGSAPSLSGRDRPVCGHLCGLVGVQRCPGWGGALQGSLLTAQKEDLREVV